MQGAKPRPKKVLSKEQQYLREKNRHIRGMEPHFDDDFVADCAQFHAEMAALAKEKIRKSFEADTGEGKSEPIPIVKPGKGNPFLSGQVPEPFGVCISPNAIYQQRVAEAKAEFSKLPPPVRKARCITHQKPYMCQDCMGKGVLDGEYLCWCECHWDQTQFKFE